MSRDSPPPVLSDVPVGSPSPARVPPALPMDPRFRRRRIEVRRAEGRRRLHILLGCLASVAAAAGGVGLSRSPLLDVDRVEVQGARRTPRPAVVAAAGLAGHPAMVDVDTGDVARRLRRLPWVRTAEASRRWPGTVRIQVTERRPAAVLPAAGGAWAVADATGRVLAVEPDRPPGLPAIGDVDRPQEAGAAVPAAAGPALRVAAALPADVRARVSDVATVAGGEVQLWLGPDSVVRLGPPVDLGLKLTALATVLARVDLSGIRVIDLRVPTAPALTRR
ncbi:MAG TPA: FtsQ-type POTRA domain-containing protein [Acidimicrobiales bacterium]|nr:FtsQ-type POTRA domain-containing protein [Acidimicrobiales bacterium]